MTHPLPHRYPRLYRLFAGYVNQDFDVHGADPLEAVRAFARDVAGAELEAARSELARLRRAKPSETSLAQALAALRCGVDPEAFGWTHAEFLRRVAAALGTSPGQAPRARQNPA